MHVVLLLTACRLPSQNSFPAIVPKPANLDSYLTPLELHVLNPAAGARDEYISPPKPRPQQRLPKLPGISSNRLNGDGVSVHSTTAASKKVGRQDEAGQANSCQPAHHETIKAFRPDAVPGGLPSSKKAKTSSGLWGDLSKTAFGPPPAPVPPAWKARSLGTTYGVTLEPIDPSPAAPGPGEGAKGLMTMKSGRMVGLPPFGGTRRMPTGRRGCIETFRQAVALATAKKPVQHRQLLSEAMFKYLFRNPVLQVCVFCPPPPPRLRHKQH